MGKQWLLSFALPCLFCAIVFAQNVVVKQSGNNAGDSAMLVVQSTKKDLLIPKIAAAQRAFARSSVNGLTFIDELEAGNNNAFINQPKFIA
jgi:hypothetical protein